MGIHEQNFVHFEPDLNDQDFFYYIKKLIIWDAKWTLDQPQT